MLINLIHNYCFTFQVCLKLYLNLLPGDFCMVALFVVESQSGLLLGKSLCCLHQFVLGL